MLVPPSIQTLMREFSRFPGIGPKTSQRLVFSLLKKPKGQILDLIYALEKFSQDIHLCQLCFNFTDNGMNSLCSICSDQKRNVNELCVVADIEDMLALEAAQCRGLYFILGGVLNPIRGVQVEDLRVKELILRVKNDAYVKEVILGFDPNQEGELTCFYLKKILLDFPIKITRLARGLPQGGDLDYADEITLREALKGRREA